MGRGVLYLTLGGGRSPTCLKELKSNDLNCRDTAEQAEPLGPDSLGREGGGGGREQQLSPRCRGRLEPHSAPLPPNLSPQKTGCMSFAPHCIQQKHTLPIGVPINTCPVSSVPGLGLLL